MTHVKDTPHIAVSREAHELIRSIAFMQRKTMRQVVEEALYKVYKSIYGKRKED